jgi:uncharacterized protein (TIGR00251 family)
VPGGVTLVVRVTPRSRKNEIIGADGEALRVKLTAPPVGGAANAALCEFLAGVLGVRKSALTLVAGQSSRHKLVRVEGITADQARTRLNDTVDREMGEGGSRVKRVEF